MTETKSHSVSIFENVTEEYFHDIIYPQRQPAILRGVNIGTCVQKWTPTYLAEVYKDKEVLVHVSTEPKMNFMKKNFIYKRIPFGELIKRTAEACHDDYFLSNTEMYYLRSIGGNPRKEKADIKVQFPLLADDIIIPNFFSTEHFFSSVFRIASPGITLWTHYDVMDNLLIQVHGTKKAVLFPPSDVPYLYIREAKSKILDVDNPDLTKYPKFVNATRYECILESGDILFIPALWFHNVTSLDFSIAVNVFWKHLDESLYDKKDTYANKDFIPAYNALALLEKSLKCLTVLPQECKEFYAKRMISHIQETVLYEEDEETDSS